LPALLILASAGQGFAGEEQSELRSLLEQQQKQIDELQRQLDAQKAQRAAQAGQPAADPVVPAIDEGAVRKIVADYLKDNPGAGMPPSVQTGYETGRGFAIRSAPNPDYVKWDDDCKIPFELRFRGRLQLEYHFYKVTDTLNHLTGQKTNLGLNRPAGDVSVLEVKRGRFIFDGTAFDPNFRYWLELEGTTRGIAGAANVSQNPTNALLGQANQGSNTVTVDHAVRLYSAYIAYDWHPCGSEKGCGEDCACGQAKYTPTITGIVGKAKPFSSLEDWLGTGNEQFVTLPMAYWMFVVDDNNAMPLAGTQVKALDDRFFMQAAVTNGSDAGFPALQLDDLPGFNAAFWYDFGGNWNERAHRWNLFGDTIADIDYSCKPVVRVGGATNMDWLDRRGIFGNSEQARIRAFPAGPGGTSFITLLNGGTITSVGSLVAGNLSPFYSIDEFDTYTYEGFAAAKYRGFSLYTDWWVRELNNFHAPNGGAGNLILYGSPIGAIAGIPTTNFIFPNHPIFDYGMVLQGGYFVVPHKVEIAGRWSWIRGESGDIFGSGKVLGAPTPVPNGAVGVPGGPPAAIVPGTTAVRLADAFRHFHEADEFTISFNYYFKRELLKWQTDLGFYTGGNPAANGQSNAGFIPGVDGWEIRSQIQLWF
jgi:hypothetical protein